MELIVGKERVRIERPAEGGYEIAVGERTYQVDAAPLRDGLYSLRVGGVQHEVAVRRGKLQDAHRCTEW